MIRALIAAGADVSARDRAGRTAFDKLKEIGRDDLAEEALP
jgi:hypothetical protein